MAFLHCSSRHSNYEQCTVQTCLIQPTDNNSNSEKRARSWSGKRSESPKEVNLLKRWNYWHTKGKLIAYLNFDKGLQRPRDVEELTTYPLLEAAEGKSSTQPWVVVGTLSEASKFSAYIENIQIHVIHKNGKTRARIKKSSCFKICLAWMVKTELFRLEPGFANKEQSSGSIPAGKSAIVAYWKQSHWNWTPILDFCHSGH